MTWLSSWLNEHDELSLSQFARGVGFNVSAIKSLAQTGRAPGGLAHLEDAIRLACEEYDRTGELINVKGGALRSGITREGKARIRQQVRRDPLAGVQRKSDTALKIGL